MPLIEERDRGTRLFAKYFSICEVAKKPREGFEEIEVDNPQTGESVKKYIKRYEKVIGRIVNLEWRDTRDRYEQQYLSWIITLDDGEGMKATLTLDFNSRPSHRFMNLAENLDFTKPVEFSAWRDISGKAPSIAFAVKQNGVKVDQLYSKDNPGERPAGIKKLGKWNFDDQMIWLHERMMHVVIPKLRASVEMELLDEEEESPF